MPTPPPVPPVADTDRYVAYAPAGATTTLVDVPFPVYGDASDLRVLVDGNEPDTGSWSLISKSGAALNTLSQPIADGQIYFAPAVAPQTIEIYGAIHPRQLAMPTAPGIGRREFNQALGYILSALREAWTLAKLFRNQPLGFDAAGPLGSRAQYDLEAAGFRFAVTDDASSTSSFLTRRQIGRRRSTSAARRARPGQVAGRLRRSGRASASRAGRSRPRGRSRSI
jgi:hypothetical protein